MLQTQHIIDIGANGDGIARLDDGSTAFVPFTAAGDIVEASIETDAQGVLRGSIRRIVTASPHRAAPPCRHFGICGGCALQHIDEATYRAFKRRQIMEPLEKAGVNRPEQLKEIYIPPLTRRRANFAARLVRGKAVMGFHERRSASIRDTPDCLLIEPALREMMNRVAGWLPRLIEDGQKIDVQIQHIEGQFEIGFTGRLGRNDMSAYDNQQNLADFAHELKLARLAQRMRDYGAFVPLLDIEPVLKRFGAIAVRIAPGGFLQPSEQGEAALVAAVTGQLENERSVADLFCGNGTFTGHLQKHYKVLAVDSADEAILALKAAGINAAYRDLFKSPLDAGELAEFDAVVLDPPRAGAKAQSLQLAQSRVAKVIYVSCNPQSFARDAAILQDGGYALSSLTLIDQFVWSAHVELAGVFVRA